MRRAANIYRLGVKELWSLVRDPMMLVLIGYTFTISIYTAATAMPESLHRASIAIVDEDGSPLSGRIATAFPAPHFNRPVILPLGEIDRGLDTGVYTFVLDIPPNFQQDVLAGRSPAVQLNIDATRMSQSLVGNSAIQQIVLREVNDFLRRSQTAAVTPVELVIRARFNPTLNRIWFGSLMEVINSVTMLSIVLAGAALIREREHGTIEHLLVMPVTPVEIMLAKVWATGAVVLAAAWASLLIVVQGALEVPIEGSIPLFLACAALHLFATTAMGILMATMARSMPQFGLLLMITILPLDLLSGGITPRESMPQFVQNVMLAAPTTHFVTAGQAILYRSAGIDVVWPQFVWLFGIGSVFFTVAAQRFRRTIGQS